MLRTFTKEFKDIPEITRTSLLAYLEYGQPTGGFLNAVLCDNLNEAVTRADLENRKGLVQLVLWLQQHAPGGAFGSEERVDAWIKHHGLKGVL